MNESSRHPHILCVDNAPEILDILRTFLEDEGYRVSTASSVGPDLDPIADLAPDLITLDTSWPTTDGDWHFLNQMRTDPRTRHVPVILCTGAIETIRNMEDHLASIGIPVVVKPFDLEAVLASIQGALASRTTTTTERPVTADR